MKSVFVVDPMNYFVNEERQNAILSLKQYFTCFTGSHFEKFADVKNPHQITEKDITAVGMLGVNIPAGTAIWVLGSGKAKVSGLLAKIPDKMTIWDEHADLAPTSRAWELWDVLRQTNWLKSNSKVGMGPTRTSKLMAAKRPHLIPVSDSVTKRALFGNEDADVWLPWQQRLRGSEGQELKDAVKDVRGEVPAAANLSVLRTIDVRRGKERIH